MPVDWRPDGPCDVVCNLEGQINIYSKVGSQAWLNLNDGVTTVDRTCSITCSPDNQLLFHSNFDQGFDNTSCFDKGWEQCPPECETSKIQMTRQSSGLCDVANVLTRACYTGKCPVSNGDYVMKLDLHFLFPMTQWSEMVSEDLTRALSSVLSLEEGNIAVVGNNSVKLDEGRSFGFLVNVEARGKNTDSARPDNALARLVNELDIGLTDQFIGSLLRALDATSKTFHNVDYSVYGWMKPKDIKVEIMCMCRLYCITYRIYERITGK